MYGDEELKRREKEKSTYEALLARNVDDALRALLSVRNGRDFLWWLLQESRYGQIGFTGNALTTAFNLGEQNVGNKLLARILETEPDGFLTMQKEKNDAARERDAATERGRNEPDLFDEPGGDDE